MNSWRETIEQPKPKPERTKPHPQKLWKKAAKAYWRVKTASAFDGHYSNLVDNAHELGAYDPDMDTLRAEISRRFVSALDPFGLFPCDVWVVESQTGRCRVSRIERLSL